MRALAVASEPSIFWRGEGVTEILKAIDVPVEAGALVPAQVSLNGPSGRALDELFLAPLGATRSETWMCDLLPESRVNKEQQRAIDKHYQPLVNQGLVSSATIPTVPRRFADEGRRREILDEIRLSRAETLITLGDIPLREFIRPLGAGPARLAHFGQSPNTYGRSHEVTLGGHSLGLLPLVHPRQASSLGQSSRGWGELHLEWIKRNSETRDFGRTPYN